MNCVLCKAMLSNNVGWCLKENEVFLTRCGQKMSKLVLGSLSILATHFIDTKSKDEVAVNGITKKLLTFVYAIT